MLPKFRETQNWYLSSSVLCFQGPQSKHFASAQIDMKDSLKRKPVVTGSQAHFIMLSTAYGGGGGGCYRRIYQSGKALSKQEGIVHNQVKSKNSDETTPRKTNKKSCPVSLSDTHGHSRASTRTRFASAMSKIRSGNGGHTGQGLI